MRQIYAERIDVLKTAADRHLNGVLDVVHAGAGIRTLGWLKTGKSDHDAAQQGQKLGLAGVQVPAVGVQTGIGTGPKTAFLATSAGIFISVNGGQSFVKIAANVPN